VTYVHITWLAATLRAKGCTVVEQPGWKTRGRPASTGQFNPRGVLLHHTASGVNSTTANPHPSLTTVINGRPDLPGPLCHVLIDWRGWCYTIAAGRANHAGQAKASGPMPAGDGNAMYVGIEIDYNAPRQTHSNAQFSAALTATAAILGHFGKNENYVRAHRETSVTGKIDPSGIDLANFRVLTGIQL
jgi:hypothetical protein